MSEYCLPLYVDKCSVQWITNRWASVRYSFSSSWIRRPCSGAACSFRPCSGRPVYRSQCLYSQCLHIDSIHIIAIYKHTKSQGDGLYSHYCEFIETQRGKKFPRWWSESPEFIWETVYFYFFREDAEVVDYALSKHKCEKNYLFPSATCSHFIPVRVLGLGRVAMSYSSNFAALITTVWVI